MSGWDDEKKQQAVQMYQEAEPTPENSMEIVKQIAEDMGMSPNGVRAILSKEGVYVKKDPTAKSTSKAGATKEGGTTRVSKEAAHTRLTTAIENCGGKVDSEIISKLTGKAAIYLADVIENK